MSKPQFALAAVVFLAGCSTTPDIQSSSIANNAKLRVAQVGMAANTEYVACKDCAPRTVKTIAVPAARASLPVSPMPVPVETAKPEEARHDHVFAVHFPFGSSSLTGDARAEITKAAEALKQLPGSGEISILGRTDAVGPKKVNHSLALKRAHAAKAALTQMGVMASKVSVGRHDPCCDGDPSAPDEVRKALRRADVQIIIKK